MTTPPPKPGKNRQGGPRSLSLQARRRFPCAFALDPRSWPTLAIFLCRGLWEMVLGGTSVSGVFRSFSFGFKRAGLGNSLALRSWPTLAIFLGLIFSGALLWAQEDVSVTATVDRNEMSQGDILTYSVSVASGSSVEIQPPTFPDLPNFNQVHSWSGSEIQSVFANGQFQTHRKKVFNFQLQALQEGEFEIGSTQVQVGESVYRTKPIRIRVLAGGGAPNLQPAPQPGGGVDLDDMFSQMLRNRLNRLGQDRPDVSGGESFFVDVDVDKKRAYEGEQVTASFYLYTQGRIAEIDTLKYPTLAGFWKEDIELATRLDFQPVIVNGVRYQRALLASYALFPIKAGKANVDPYKARCKVITLPSFGIPRTQQETKESQNVEIEVTALPEAGRPANFSGGVGDFQLKTVVDQKVLKTHQPVSLKFRFEGRGNAKLIEMPKLEIPKGFELYDTSSESKFFKDGRSFKVFEVLLVPRQVGDVQVPSFAVGFFNPDTKSYYEVQSEAVDFSVEKGEDQGQIPSSQLEDVGGTVQKPKKSLPQLALDFDAEESKVGLWKWPVLYLVLLVGLLVYTRRELGWGKPRENLRRRLERRMKSIRSNLQKKDWKLAASQSIGLVYMILGELSGLGGGSQELKKMLAKAPPSFRREHQTELEKIMSELEVIAYAPDQVAASLRQAEPVQLRVKSLEKLLTKALEQDFSDVES